MKKTSLFRILSLVLAMCLSFGLTSAVAFAEDTPVTPIDVDEDSIGAVLVYDSKDFVNSVTMYLTLSSGNWSADFLATVTGNAGALYQVDMTTPGGSTYTVYITSNTGDFTKIVTLAYASAGTYTFKFTRLSGSAVSAHAVAEICD